MTNKEASLEFVGLAEAALELDAQRIQSKDLMALRLPEAQVSHHADGSKGLYFVYGDLDSAQELVFTTQPYTTRISDRAQQVRLKAGQMALGPDYCLIGASTYMGTDGEYFSSAERSQIAAGSFRPHALRLLDVVNAVAPRPDQAVSIFGFSAAGDIGIEFVWQALHNEHFDSPPIQSLGSFDYARSVQRGRLAMTWAFLTSGKELFQNVIDSRSPALLQARCIGLDDKHAELWHMAEVVGTVAMSTLLDLRGSIAHMSGFATDMSTAQLRTIAERNDRPPYITVGYTMRDKVFDRRALRKLPTDASFDIVGYPADHSAADNLQKHAAMLRRTVGF